MGTKERPGTFDCYAAAASDEPLFTLLARDDDAPTLVEEWAARRARKLALKFAGVPGALESDEFKRALRKVAEAQQCANNMRRWKRAHP